MCIVCLYYFYSTPYHVRSNVNPCACARVPPPDFLNDGNHLPSTSIPIRECVGDLLGTISHRVRAISKFIFCVVPIVFYYADMQYVMYTKKIDAYCLVCVLCCRTMYLVAFILPAQKSPVSRKSAVSCFLNWLGCVRH